jgi:hypothetical protein
MLTVPVVRKTLPRVEGETVIAAWQVWIGRRSENEAMARTRKENRP